jgi:toxin ParE1/3/4
MKGIVYQRQRARQDLIDIFRYYARKAGRKTACRFLAQVESTFKKLAEIPGMGAPYEAESPVFAGIRVCPIIGFKKYLAFYRPLTDGVDVIRVLHGARDIDEILVADFENN